MIAILAPYALAIASLWLVCALSVGITAIVRSVLHRKRIDRRVRDLILQRRAYHGL